MDEKAEIYKGKNALWVYAVAVFYNLLPLFSFSLPKNVSDWWILAAVFLLYYAFDFILIPILARNRIEITGHKFTFYYGFGKTTYEIYDLKHIRLTHNPIAASANSLDRIEMDFGDRELIVSLRDNDGFIRRIKEIHPVSDPIK